MSCDCERAYGSKSPCSEPSRRELKVSATLKKDYWVEDIKRYVVPRMYFVPDEERNDKPFVCETKNVAFRLNSVYSVSDVLMFDAFESVTISTI